MLKNTNLLTRLWLILFSLFLIVSCKKDVSENAPEGRKAASKVDKEHGHLVQTKKYSSEVALKWLDLMVRLIQQPAQLQRLPFRDQYQDRYFAYVAIALYESVVPGMPAYQSLSGQLSEMPLMPEAEPGKAYHWPTAANAALAYIHKGLLYSITPANRVAVDSLEGALAAQYQSEVDAATFERSVAFGRAVAALVVQWSETDGAFATYPPYTQHTGPGLWVPTPPNFAAPTLVHYGDLRPLMPGVLSETLAPPPIPYSTDPSSAFYQSMKEVYDMSQTRSAEQTAQALYWRNNVQTWFGILKKIALEEGAMLDIVALAQAKMGIATLDAAIAGWKTKYTYNVMRPVTYIRNVMGYTTWNSLFPTNANPDYPDGVVPDYSASAGAMSAVFGANYAFNTDGADPVVYKGYSFDSFEEAAYHGGESRFIAGVTTKWAVAAGLAIGFKTVAYMEEHIDFHK